ncbi:FGGY-family carbohydrate kinase [Amycolatopsis rhabdoformis]|uniref:FGGY-family carbohydrate kinase n=1 Tax=Amycolatopsis rhabdoformis TaxID=1448059 RepID=A0ABZ1IK41_9PSEU|nr:FGGY-family carbohydrate kinase [Amycolatopsis rhabdoformis]WSE34118.1 FGGY-family carbohydrate kinase [Amycolatopsis rhabdoformis]
MAATYLGIDLGTSVTKAVVLDENGTQLAARTRRTKLHRPAPGHFEQDPEEVLRSVADVTRAAVAAAGATPGLIGLTGQGDGVWLTDEHGHAVRRAVSWMDARGASTLRRWRDQGVVAKVFRRTGNAIFPGSAAPILAWLEEHEPASLDRAATAAYCKDFVMQRLSGLRATDASDASLPFLDPVTREYDQDVLSWCGLSHRADLLAPIAKPLPGGTLTNAAGDLLGLPAGTPISAGPFDLPASALGAGVTAPGDGHLTVGTTLACQVVVDAVRTTGEPAGMTLATLEPDRWLRAMPATVGTAALDWVLDLVGRPVDAVEGLLSDSPPLARGVTCLPYFSPAGERAPFLEPGARARVDGLTLNTDRADLVRATCEAVAYAARHCFAAAGLTGEITLGGGGTRSAAWSRIFADVLGRPVRLAWDSEPTARGAVLAAAHAAGHRLDPIAWTAPTRVIEPDSERAARYDDGFANFLTRVSAARASWQETGTDHTTTRPAEGQR